MGGGKNSGKACHGAAVVVHGLHSGLHGVAGGDGSGQNEHMLALDHGGQIVAQDDLAAGGVLRGDHINGLVGVHVGKAVLGQFVGKAGADHLRAVQTEHGVHNGAVLVSGHQLLCHGLGLGKAGLLGGDIDVIVDMAVAGSKVALCYAQEQVTFFGGKLYHIDHRNSTPFQVFRVAPQMQKAPHRCDAPAHFYNPIVPEKKPVHKA